MKTDVLHTLAASLAELYTEQAREQNLLEQLTQARERLEIELTPPGGWLGKNEEARKIERYRVLAGDGEWASLTERLAQCRRELTSLAGGIAAQEAQRRAHEWHIRAALARVLAGQDEPEAVFTQALDQATAVPE